MVQSENSVVDRLYSDFQQLVDQIDATEISLRNSAEEIFQKSLYVAIGSHFEQRITDHILELVGRSSRDNVLVTEFARIKGVSRQYHTFFGWGDSNANRFFSMFGREFRDYMVEYVKNDDQYDESIKAFLEVGNVRNEVAHDFGSVSLDKTVEEIYARYKQALAFVEQIPLRFDEFEQTKQDTVLSGVSG